MFAKHVNRRQEAISLHMSHVERIKYAVQAGDHGEAWAVNPVTAPEPQSLPMSDYEKARLLGLVLDCHSVIRVMVGCRLDTAIEAMDLILRTGSKKEYVSRLARYAIAETNPP